MPFAFCVPGKMGSFREGFMRYPLVVFDFDGTLADSFGPALAAFGYD